VRTDNVGFFPRRGDPAGGIRINEKRYVDTYQHVLKTLKHQMTHGDVLVISMYAGNWHDDNGGIKYAHGNSGRIVDLETTPVGMMERDLLESIVEPVGGKLYVFGEWPYFNAPGNGFRKEPNEANGRQRAEGEVNFQADLQTALEPVIKRHTALHYVPLIHLFCKPGTVLDKNWTVVPHSAGCSDIIPGTGLVGYSNDNHVNTVGSMYMWPYICEAMQGA
jgi:hypothetical protein